MYKVSLASAELDEEDIQAVVQVLRSGRLALGPKIQEFEQMIADYVGVKYGYCSEFRYLCFALDCQISGDRPGR